MEKARTKKGTEIDASTAGLIKSAIDGVSVNVVLTGDELPFGLELTMNWPNGLPKTKVDFGIASYNEGHSFFCLFSNGSYGPKQIYSENSHSSLVRDLAKTKTIIINEIASDGARTYHAELKYCE